MTKPLPKIGEIRADQIARDARSWALSVKLESQQQLDTAVSELLNDIRGNGAEKRRATVLSLAEAAVNSTISRTAVFERDDTLSRGTFYDRWYDDAEFRQILERVIALYERWTVETELRAAMERQRQWREDTWKTANRALGVAMQILDQPLEVIVVNDDGSTTNQPSGLWTMKDAATLAAAADKLARLALELPTEIHENKITVDDSDLEDIRAALDQKFADIMTRMAPAPAAEEDG